MLLDNIDITSDTKYPFILTLMNSKGDELAIINEAYDRNLEINSEATHKLSFTIPYKINDQFSNIQIKNDNYDLVQVGGIIKLNEEHKFLIIDADDNEGQADTKNITCESLERLLSNRFITLNAIERQLYRNGNQVEISDGVFELLNQEITSWSVGYIDPNVQVETINGSSITKYRFFDKFRKSVYEFLRSDVSSAFNLHIEYDTMLKQYKIFDRDNYGVHTNLYISKENYAKVVKRKVIGENIVTRLHVSGKDGISIEDFNIMGTDYIEDFSYYRNSGQMSSELSSALDMYNSFLIQKNTIFQGLKTQLDSLNSSLVVKQSELSTLEEEIKALKGIQSACIASKDNVNLPTATTNVNNKQTEINNKQAEITSLNSQITSKQNQISQLATDIQRVNARNINTNQLMFNTALLNELDNFIREDDWSNENYTNAESLYKASRLILNDWSQPPIEFEIDMVDFLSCVDCQEDWDKLSLGDFVTVYISNLDAHYEMRIVSYVYNPDSNSLKITFSNKSKKLEDIRSSGGIINKAVEAGRDVNLKRLEWNQIKGTKDAFEVYSTNFLDMAKQNVSAMRGRNRFSITEDGQVISDTQNPDHQLILTSGQLVITDDNLQTVRTAINSSGCTKDTIEYRVIIQGE